MITNCPNCQKRIVVGFDTTDYIHECDSGRLALDQEDVVVTGNWEDYTGSGVKASQAVLMQGAENELFGTRAGNEGFDEESKTARGNKASTHRSRQHLEFININALKTEKTENAN